jgi:hypothetical protein
VTDVGETIFQELSKLESKQETQAGATEEGLSPEVRQKMEEGRQRAEEVGEELRLEQAGNAALGEPIEGDVAGVAVTGELEEEKRQADESGLSPEVQQRMAEGRARTEQVTADLAAAQNESAALGEMMPGDVAGEGLKGTVDSIDEEDRDAAARAADSSSR